MPFSPKISEESPGAVDNKALDPGQRPQTFEYDDFAGTDPLVRMADGWKGFGNIDRFEVDSGGLIVLGSGASVTGSEALSVTIGQDFKFVNNADDIVLAPGLVTSTLHLMIGPGDFTLPSSLDISSLDDICIKGCGAGITTIRKNFNDYLIKGIGSSGNLIRNVKLEDFTVAQVAGDTDENDLIHLAYVKDGHVRHVEGTEARHTPIHLTNCDYVGVEDNIIHDVHGFPDTASARTKAIHVGSGCNTVRVIGNTCYDNGNLIDRGNCESGGGASPEDGNSPMMFDESNPDATNCTWQRSSDFAYEGTHSYKFTKAVATGTNAWINLVDNTLAADMHGLVAGVEYPFEVYIYIPTASGILGSEILLQIIDYQGGSAVTSQAAANTYDAWQKVTVTRTLRAGATGARIRIYSGGSAEINEYFYVDKVLLLPVGTHNEHKQNFKNSGTGTQLSANSFQNPFPA